MKKTTRNRSERLRLAALFLEEQCDAGIFCQRYAIQRTTLESWLTEHRKEGRGGQFMRVAVAAHSSSTHQADSSVRMAVGNVIVTFSKLPSPTYLQMLVAGLA